MYASLKWTFWRLSVGVLTNITRSRRDLRHGCKHVLSVLLHMRFPAVAEGFVQKYVGIMSLTIFLVSTLVINVRFQSFPGEVERQYLSIST